MLRSELAAGTNAILKAIEESGLPLAVRSILEREKESNTEQLLASFSRYMQLYQSFGSVERSIVDILGLETLHNMKFWASMLSADSARGHHEAMAVYHRLDFAQQHLPRLLALIRRETDEPLTREPEKKRDKGVNAILTAVVIEDKRRSSPLRLVNLLESIDGLYSACATIIGEKGGDLAVTSCDSGSDKSFDFLGAAEIVECVKEVILSFWNKVVYFREDKTGKRLEVIADALPILDRISELKDKGKIEPERAELLKRQVIGSITKFAAAGVTIPEIAQFTVFNPRQLMKPEPKLLVASTEDAAAPAEGDQSEEDAVDIEDPEFKKYMKQMATQFMKKKASKRRKALGKGPDHSEAQPGG
jgi:hypothetical protein